MDDVDESAEKDNMVEGEDAQSHRAAAFYVEFNAMWLLQALRIYQCDQQATQANRLKANICCLVCNSNLTKESSSSGYVASCRLYECLRG